MDTLEMISKALETVVEQKVAEKARTVNLDSVLEFIRNSTEEDRMEIINCFITSYPETLEEYYQERLKRDYSVIIKDELRVADVDDAGILEDCFNEYLDSSSHANLREIAKDIIDRF